MIFTVQVPGCIGYTRDGFTVSVTSVCAFTWTSLVSVRRQEKILS